MFGGLGDLAKMMQQAKEIKKKVEEMKKKLSEAGKVNAAEIVEEIVGGVSENHEKIVSTFLGAALCESEAESKLLEREYGNLYIPTFLFSWINGEYSLLLK